MRDEGHRGEKIVVGGMEKTWEMCQIVTMGEKWGHVVEMEDMGNGRSKKNWGEVG